VVVVVVGGGVVAFVVVGCGFVQPGTTEALGQKKCWAVVGEDWVFFTLAWDGVVRQLASVINLIFYFQVFRLILVIEDTTTWTTKWLVKKSQ